MKCGEFVKRSLNWITGLEATQEIGTAPLGGERVSDRPTFPATTFPVVQAHLVKEFPRIVT